MKEYFVYVLYDRYKNFYVGFTTDLKKRIHYHQNGLVASTKVKLPVNLIYYEVSFNRYDAIKRERFLKSGPGKRYLKNRLKQQISNKPQAS